MEQIVTSKPLSQNADTIEPILPPKKKRFWRPLLLALCFFILLNLLSLLLEPYFLALSNNDYTYTLGKLTLYYNKPTPDVMFMGSSRTLTGFNPTIIEQEVEKATGNKIRALNMGMALGSGIDLHYLVLKNLIRDDRKPAVIVYGISEYEIMGAGTPHRSDNVPYFSILQRPDDFELYSGDTLDKKADFILNQALPIYRNQKLILNGLSVQFNPDNPANLRNDNLVPVRASIKDDGYLLFPNRGPLTKERLEAFRPVQEAFLSKYKIENAELIYLKNFISVAKQRGIKVILVDLPVHPELRTWWHSDSTIQQYQELLKNFAEKNNVPLLDLYVAGDKYIPADGFVDIVHFSDVGATALSTVFVQNTLAPFFKAQFNLDNFYRSGLTDIHLPTRMLPYSTYTGSLLLENKSTSIWPISGKNPVTITYHWRKSDGTELKTEAIQPSPLPETILPGQKKAVYFQVITPHEPGNYLLEMDLDYQGISNFRDKGNPTLIKQVTIAPGVK